MRPLIAGNWKMHGLNVDLHKIELVAGWAQKFESLIDALICPPTTLIRDAARIAEGRLEIGGQDCHSEVSGAHTGDIGAEMLRDAAASVVLVGHSERRQNHGESDALVAAKAAAAKRAGLSAIVWVGETGTQRANGRALSIAGGQIIASVPAGMQTRSSAPPRPAASAPASRPTRSSGFALGSFTTSSPRAKAWKTTTSTSFAWAEV